MLKQTYEEYLAAATASLNQVNNMQLYRDHQQFYPDGTNYLNYDQRNFLNPYQNPYSYTATQNTITEANQTYPSKV